MAEIDELFGNEKQTTIEPYSKDEWIKQYEYLKQYYNKHGNLDIPINYEEKINFCDCNNNHINCCFL